MGRRLFRVGRVPREANLIDDLGKVGIAKLRRQWEEAGLQAQVHAPLQLLPQGCSAGFAYVSV